MRLLQSVLSRLKPTEKPQHKFVAHLLGLMLMRPAHATFRNMRRYSPHHKRALHDGTTPTGIGYCLTRQPSPKSSLLSRTKLWALTPLSCPKVVHAPISSIASGMVAIAARRKSSKFNVEQTPLSAVTSDAEDTRIDVLEEITAVMYLVM